MIGFIKSDGFHSSDWSTGSPSIFGSHPTCGARVNKSNCVAANNAGVTHGRLEKRNVSSCALQDPKVGRPCLLHGCYKYLSSQPGIASPCDKSGCMQKVGTHRRVVKRGVRAGSAGRDISCWAL